MLICLLSGVLIIQSFTRPRIASADSELRVGIRRHAKSPNIVFVLLPMLLMGQLAKWYIHLPIFSTTASTYFTV